MEEEVVKKKPSKKKIALIVLASILSAILLIVIICVGVGVGFASKVHDDTVAPAELSSWQNWIKDDALVKSVIMPGAHDAGTKTMPWYSETQDRDIPDLLKCGVRYIDLRIKIKDGECRIHHGPAYSYYVKDVLDDVKAFLEANPSEGLVIDFQNLKGEDVERAAFALLKEKLGDKCVINDKGISDVDFVNTLTLGEFRGKCLAIWSGEHLSAAKKTDVDTYKYIFNRDGDESESCLKSYYTRKWNSHYSSKKYIDKALPVYINNYKQSGKGLFILQGQLTDGALVFGPRYREGGHEENMNEYIRSLAGSEELAYINILMRDFMSPIKAIDIITLNLSKGLVKPEYVANRFWIDKLIVSP